MFFGYSKYHILTAVLIDLKLPSFNTIMHNKCKKTYQFKTRCKDDMAILSKVFGHNYHMDICLLIFATFQRILKFVACFRRKLA